MKKLISVIAACIGALVLAAGIALPSASADPTNAPSPGPTVANQPPGAPLDPEDDPAHRRPMDSEPSQGDAGTGALIAATKECNPMKKLISVIAACVGAPLLAAGIAVPSASADPTNAPSPGPTVATNHPIALKTWMMIRGIWSVVRVPVPITLAAKELRTGVAPTFRGSANYCHEGVQPP